MELTTESPQPSTVPLTEYSEAFARRRAQYVLAHVPFFITIGLGVVTRSGFTVVAVVLAAALAVEVLVIATTAMTLRAYEDRRRLGGQDPTWDARDADDVHGRLRSTPFGFEWQAGRRFDATETHRISWPADTTVSVYRTWGLGQPGLVRFTTADGRDDVLTVLGTQDLLRHLCALHARSVREPVTVSAVRAA